jgi:hypothetical protein
VLCPVRRPVTTLVCILLKDNSLVFAAGLGPKITYVILYCFMGEKTLTASGIFKNFKNYCLFYASFENSSSKNHLSAIISF